MSGDDQRLIEHVLEGQRALQESNVELHAACARIEERLNQALPALVGWQERSNERVGGLDKRLSGLEKRVLVLTATGSGVTLALTVIWKVLGG